MHANMRKKGEFAGDISNPSALRLYKLCKAR